MRLARGKGRRGGCRLPERGMGLVVVGRVRVMLGLAAEVV